MKALVSDTVKASQSYGSYVTPLSLDINNPNAAMAALKRVSTVICLGSEGKLLQVAQQAGVQHVVLLSQTGERACVHVHACMLCFL